MTFCRELANHPLKDLKFSFFILKIKKYRVRRSVHFAVLCNAKYRYGEKIFHRNGRFFPPSTLINHSLQTVLVRGKTLGRAQAICLYQGIFPLKKQIWEFFLKNVRGIF
jgi:hypothetical protein